MILSIAVNVAFLMIGGSLGAVAMALVVAGRRSDKDFTGENH